MILLIPVFGIFASAGEKNIGLAETTKNIDYSRFKGTKLNVFNWGFYISDGTDGSVNVNDEFEKLTGIKVVYDTYDSNESMYPKIAESGVNYDIIIPSDYMIARLIEENRLHKINFDNIPNYRYISEKYKNAPYDPEDEYSVPYSVGMVGIIYNTTVVSGKPDSWELMWDDRYREKILNFNNPRDAFGTAQLLLGLDVNSENKEDWDKAYEKLLEQKKFYQGYVMDQVFNKMESGEASIAPYYAGDFFTMYGNNKDLAFYYPKEGTNVFVDAVCIPENAKHKEAAELYINFLLDPAIGKANAEYIYYASPNTGVMEDKEYREFLQELHPDAYNILYGTNDDYNAVTFLNLSDDMKAHMNDLWGKLKSSNDGMGIGVYIVFFVIIGIIIALAVASAVRKRRRRQE